MPESPKDLTCLRETIIEVAKEVCDTDGHPPTFHQMFGTDANNRFSGDCHDAYHVGVEDGRTKFARELLRDFGDALKSPGVTEALNETLEVEVTKGDDWIGSSSGPIEPVIRDVLHLVSICASSGPPLPRLHIVSRKEVTIKELKRIIAPDKPPTNPGVNPPEQLQFSFMETSTPENP